jgi:hypothetical protein
MGFEILIYRADDALFDSLQAGVDPQSAAAFANQLQVFTEASVVDDRQRILDAFQAHRNRMTTLPDPDMRYDIARVLCAYVDSRAVLSGQVGHNTLAGNTFRQFVRRTLANSAGLANIGDVLHDRTVLQDWEGYPSIGRAPRSLIPKMLKAMLTAKSQDEDEMNWIRQFRQALADVDWSRMNLVATYS